MSLVASLGDMGLLEQWRTIERGLPAKRIEQLRARLEASQAEMQEAMDMAPATYKRRVAANARLSLQETESLVRLARNLALAESILGDDARGWFREAHPHLDGATPLGACRTEPGGRAVENMLLAIEHGILA